MIRTTTRAATLAALSVLATTLLACAGTDDTPPPADAADDSTRAPATALMDGRSDTLLVASLEGGPDGSASASGTVRFLSGSNNGPVRLSLEATGLPLGQHDWHIHDGPCGAGGPISIALSPAEGMEGIVGPLEVGEDRRVSTEVAIPSLDRSVIGLGRHSLHIHELSGADHGPTIVCATF